jgi:hypothetical protein
MRTAPDIVTLSTTLDLDEKMFLEWLHIPKVNCQELINPPWQKLWDHFWGIKLGLGLVILSNQYDPAINHVEIVVL